MRRINLITILLITLWSCKKTKLKGDLNYLVGEWEWVMTKNITGLSCNNISVQTPQTEGYTYRLKFEEKGILRLYKNGKQEKKYRLVKNFIHQMGTDKYEYAFYLNNRKKKDFFCRIHIGTIDTLYNIPDIPIAPPDENICFDPENVFVKVR